jgi:hypothetical protein
MNNLADRRNRILKIRTVERRIAELELAQANRKLQNVSGLAVRTARWHGFAGKLRNDYAAG